MAATPEFKVFNPQGEYVAACKHAEDAAALVALYGNGAEIRYGHSRRSRLWREGDEVTSGADSYDAVAAHCHDVIAEWVAAQRRSA